MKRQQQLRRRRRGPDALLTQKLDAAWSLLTKANTPYCERCEQSGRRLDAAHIIPRTNFRTRWEPRNAMTLCSLPCHKWWHDNALEAADWIRSHRPEDVAYLDSIKNEISHWTAADKREMLEDLRSSLEQEAA